MATWARQFNSRHCLRGIEGDLVWIRVTVEPRELENLLEALAALSFPVNPEITHAEGARRVSVVEFPAYAGRLFEIDFAVRGAGLPAACITVEDMLRYLQQPA